MVAIFGRIGVHFARLGAWEQAQGGGPPPVSYLLSMDLSAALGNGFYNMMVFG